MTGEVPGAWAGHEAVVWLDLGTEGLVFDASGRVTQGIAPGGLYNNVSWRGTRPVVELAPLLAAGSRAVEFWVQASAMDHPADEKFEEPVRMPLPSGGHPEGRVHHAQLVRFDRAVWDLYLDFEVLLDLTESLPAAAMRRAKLLRHLTLASEHLARAPHDLAAARAALRPAFDPPATRLPPRPTCACLPSGTGIWTPPGSGPSLPDARNAPAPSPTNSFSWNNTRSTSSGCPPRSITNGWRRTIPTSSPA